MNRTSFQPDIVNTNELTNKKKDKEQSRQVTMIWIICDTHQSCINVSPLYAINTRFFLENIHFIQKNL